MRRLKKVLKIILIAICIFILFLYWFIHSTSKTLIVKLILNVLLLLNSIKAANLASMLSTENITKNVKK